MSIKKFLTAIRSFATFDAALAEFRRRAIRRIWGGIQYHGRFGTVTAEGLLSSGSVARANFRSWPIRARQMILP